MLSCFDWKLPGKKDSMVFVSLRLSLCLFHCLFCPCLCLCLLIQAEPVIGPSVWSGFLSPPLNQESEYCSFIHCTPHTWNWILNTNNMQICGSLALFKTRSVCGASQRALLSQTHQSRLNPPCSQHPLSPCPCPVLLLTIRPQRNAPSALAVKLTLQRIRHKKAPTSEKSPN